MDNARSPPPSPRKVSPPQSIIAHLTSKPSVDIHRTSVHKQPQSRAVSALRSMTQEPSAYPSKYTTARPIRRELPPNPWSLAMDYESCTAQQLAEKAKDILQMIQLRVTEFCSLLEHNIHQNEESSRDALESLKDLAKKSYAISMKMEEVKVMNEGGMESIGMPLNDSRAVIQEIIGIVRHWTQAPKYPNDLPWIKSSQEGWKDCILGLHQFEANANEAGAQFEAFILAWSRARIRELNSKLFYYKATIDNNPPIANPDTASPHIHEDIRRLSQLLRHTWRQYKDVPQAYLRRHEFYRRSPRDPAGTWLIVDPTFISWRQNSSHGILWCRGEPGVGKSVLASRVIDSLQRNECQCAYFYLGTGKVQSASGVVLALLEQLCALTGSLPPSLKRTGQSTEGGTLKGNRAFQAMDYAVSQDIIDGAPRVRRMDADRRNANEYGYQGSIDDEQRVTATAPHTETLVDQDHEAETYTPLKKHPPDQSIVTRSYSPDQTSNPLIRSRGDLSPFHSRLPPEPWTPTFIRNAKDEARYNSPIRLGSCRAAPKLETLLNALRETCSSQKLRSKPLFIILDAWDADNMDVAKEFQMVIEILSYHPCKLYISSRPSQAFEATPQSIIDIKDDQIQQAEDISRYIIGELRDGLGSRANPIPAKLIWDTTKEILFASSAVFNVASIMTNMLLRAADPREHIKQLKQERIYDLPPREICLQLLNPKNQLIDINPISRVIILYLLEARCPLSLGALEASLPTILKFRYLLDHDFEGKNLKTALRDCEPFVTIDHSNQLVHLNAAVNDRDIASFWPGEAPEVYLAIIRASVELIDEKKSLNGLYEAESDIANLLLSHPELEDAATWPEYVQRLANSGRIEFSRVNAVISKILDSQESLLFALQIYIYTKEENRRIGMTWDGFNGWIKSMNKLQILAYWGFTWSAQQIIENMPEELNSTSSTALYRVGEECSEDIAVPLENNSHADCFNVEGKTPLEYALENGHLDTFIYLFNAQVEKGARVEQISEEITLAYCRARSNIQDSSQDHQIGELTVFRILSEEDEQQAEVISFLLDKGTDPNCVNDQGEPALYLAVKYKKEKMLTSLLEHKADPSKKTSSELRESPLHLAARLGLAKIARLLLEAGANVNSLDFTNRTPLFATLDCENTQKMEDIISTLVVNGANIDHADIRGRRPLHVAAEKSLVTPLLLFEYWAKEKNPRDNEGCTPLDYAKRSGTVQVQWILSNPESSEAK